MLIANVQLDGAVSRETLQGRVDHFFFWLLISSAVVLIGVALEAPQATADLKNWWRLRTGRASIENAESWIVPASYLGLLLVIAGVLGEGVFEGLVSQADTNLRRFDLAALAETQLETANAEKDAVQARKDTWVLQKETARLKTEAAEARENAAVANLKLARLKAPIYQVEVRGGIAAPDLSRGFNQRVALSGDVTIVAPRLPRRTHDQSIVWTLFEDQDSKGQHKYSMPFLPPV